MDRKYFGNISIHYNSREDMGVWCEMSGQGCRNFEDLTTLSDKWQTNVDYVYTDSVDADAVVYFPFIKDYHP